MRTAAERVICLGDSMMLGLNTSKEGKSYIELLRDYYMYELNSDYTAAVRSQKAVFYNLGVWNETVPKLASRVEEEAGRRVLRTKDGEPDIAKNLFVVNVGTNDSWINLKSRLPVTTMEAFGPAVEQVATTLATMGRILHVGILACDETVRSQVVGLEVPSLIERQVAYESKAIEIFRSVGALSVPLAMASLYESDFWPLGEDGIHCSDQGERWVFAQIKSAFGLAAGQSECPGCHELAQRQHGSVKNGE